MAIARALLVQPRLLLLDEVRLLCASFPGAGQCSITAVQLELPGCAQPPVSSTLPPTITVQATSALDSESEFLVQQALDNATQARLLTLLWDVLPAAMRLPAA